MKIEISYDNGTRFEVIDCKNIILGHFGVVYTKDDGKEAILDYSDSFDFITIKE